MRLTIHQTILAAVTAVALTAGTARAATPISGPAPIPINASGSYVLTGNLDAMGGDGIVINANNVTLDLRGFTISNASGFGKAGVRVTVNRFAVTIQNGTITNGFDGVKLDGNNSRITIQNLTLTNLNSRGITDPFDVAIQTTRSLIQRNRISDTGGPGIAVSATYTEICNNRITKSEGCGIALRGDHLRLICNEASNGVGSDSCGILALGVDDSTFARNTCSNNGTNGIILRSVLGGCDRNLVLSNKCNRNAPFGGIVVEIGSTQNRLEGNFATGNSPFDLIDLNPTTVPCANTWVKNFFNTDNEIGPAFGPGAGCIR